MTTSVQPCTTDITGFEFAKPCETGISDCQCEAVALTWSAHCNETCGEYVYLCKLHLQRWIEVYSDWIGANSGMLCLSCSRMVTWTLEDNLKVIWL